MSKGPGRQTKLRVRVLAAVLAITVVAFAGFDIVAVAELRSFLLNQNDAALQTVLDFSNPRIKVLIQRSEEDGPTLAPELQRVLGSDDYLAFVPAHGSPDILAEDPDLTPRVPTDLEPLATSGKVEAVPGSNGSTFRLRADYAGGGIIVTGADVAGMNSTVGQLRTIVTIGSAIAVALIALGVVLIVRRGLRPLESMADQADRISTGDLGERVSPADRRSEVGRLGAALNDMLARIEASIRAREGDQLTMRQFFADASHELRTPLASLRANAELHAQGALGSRAQIDEAMRRIGIEAQRMSKLVDDMLRLSRLDQHPERQEAAVDLTAVLHQCYERVILADPGRAWTADISDDLLIVGDEDLLRSAVDNLLTNVRAHTPEGTHATLSAARADHTIVIEVSDDGPGVPRDRLPRLFDRFYRAGPHTSLSGSGLGLAIVARIAAAHDGTARAALNQPHGMRITLTLPGTHIQASQSPFCGGSRHHR